MQPRWAWEGYVRALTRPGDLVVDLFCQGATPVQESVVAGRRALGFSVNPLLLLVARLGLGRCTPDALNAAFTRLADSRKGDLPLHRHLADLYRSHCPTCGGPGVAVWFAWDRDGEYPFEKAVRCPGCKMARRDEIQSGPPDGEDVENARHVQPHGLAYYYALDRAAPLDHPARERAAELVELYTPRNLAALMDLTMRLDRLSSDLDDGVMTALTGVLLDCFDAGSSLAPYGEERSRPRTLRLPSRYIERNVWLCFEEGFVRLLADISSPQDDIPSAVDVATLLAGPTTGYALVSHAARDVQAVVPTGSAALLFADPPRPDGVFWALSALWAGWLWDSPSARAMRPLLRRRRFDWDWHRRALQAALQAAGPLLTSDGYLITLFSDTPNVERALAESVSLAARGAGYTLSGWGYSPEVGQRLVWRWEAETGDEDVETLYHALADAAEWTVVSTLRERGEPTCHTLLHASACTHLAERERTVPAASAEGSADQPEPFAQVADALRFAFESPAITRCPEPTGSEDSLWWLTDPEPADHPLADRVGYVVWELLARQSDWSLPELEHAIYAHFPGSLTPDLALVLVCIESYSIQEGDRLRLRPEDDPGRRADEVERLGRDLVTLGQRLGFEVRRQEEWDLGWSSQGRQVYVFDISAAVALGRCLLGQRESDVGAQRCLVLPGGRAALVNFRLQRDSRLARAVQADGWQFVKFRHLRRLLTEETLDRHALKTVLGLDPIVEQGAAQIPLF